MKLSLKNAVAVPLMLGALALFLFALSPRESQGAAVDGYVPLATIPGTVNSTGKTDLSTYMTGMFKFGIAAAGVLAFITIVWGGFTYLSTDSIMGKEEGKHYIQRALGGLILALASYIILNTINPKLVELDLHFGDSARQASRTTAPTSTTYNERLDAKIAEINKLLDETKATAQPLEKAALDAELERNEIFAAYASGELDGLTPEEQQQVLDRLKELDGTIKTSKTQAQAVRDYNTAVAVIKNSRFEAIEAVARETGAKRDQQADLHIQAIQSKAKKEIQALEKAAATDPAHKQQYTGWADDLRKQFGDAIRAIRKEEGKAADKDLQDLQSATIML